MPVETAAPSRAEWMRYLINGPEHGGWQWPREVDKPKLLGFAIILASFNPDGVHLIPTLGVLAARAGITKRTAARLRDQVVDLALFEKIGDAPNGGPELVIQFPTSGEGWTALTTPLVSGDYHKEQEKEQLSEKEQLERVVMADYPPAPTIEKQSLRDDLVSANAPVGDNSTAGDTPTADDFDAVVSKPRRVNGHDLDDISHRHKCGYCRDEYQRRRQERADHWDQMSADAKRDWFARQEKPAVAVATDPPAERPEPSPEPMPKHDCNDPTTPGDPWCPCERA